MLLKMYHAAKNARAAEKIKICKKALTNRVVCDNIIFALVSYHLPLERCPSGLWSWS